MKTACLFILFFGFIFNGLAQDLIVTNEGDSIHCKITRISIDQIRYLTKVNNKVKKRTIKKNDVRQSVPNFYENMDVEEESNILSNDGSKHRFALNGGYAYRTAKIASNTPNEIRDYLKDLKSGYQYGADYTYFFNESMGIGAKYHVFKSEASFGTVSIINLADSTVRTGLLSDDITISFIGPSITSRSLSFNNRSAVYGSLALGYMNYHNNAVIIDEWEIEGGTFSIAYALGADLEIAKNLQLGIEASYYTGVLTKVTYSDGVNTQTIELNRDEYESLNRFDISLGFRVIL